MWARGRSVGQPGSIITEVSFLAMPAFSRVPQYDALRVPFATYGKLWI
jgi:hypothetical protein